MKKISCIVVLLSVAFSGFLAGYLIGKVGESEVERGGQGLEERHLSLPHPNSAASKNSAARLALSTKEGGGRPKDARESPPITHLTEVRQELFFREFVKNSDLIEALGLSDYEAKALIELLVDSATIGLEPNIYANSSGLSGAYEENQRLIEHLLGEEGVVELLNYQMAKERETQNQRFLDELGATRPLTENEALLVSGWLEKQPGLEQIESALSARRVIELEELKTIEVLVQEGVKQELGSLRPELREQIIRLRLNQLRGDVKAVNRQLNFSGLKRRH